ncbi:MAG: hypothetical protein AAF391_08975, partial [Bacteroidota bacterium]
MRIYIIIGLLNMICLIPLSSQELEYSYLEDGLIHIGWARDGKGPNKFKQWNLTEEDQVKITQAYFLRNTHLPFCWKKIADKIIIVYGYGSFPVEGQILIERLEIEQRDSLSAQMAMEMAISGLIDTYGDTLRAYVELGYEKVRKRNSRRFAPVADWYAANYFLPKDTFLNRILLPTSYDLLAVDSNLIKCFVRTNSGFTVWHFHYPNIGIPDGDQDWEEISTY